MNTALSQALALIHTLSEEITSLEFELQGVQQRLYDADDRACRLSSDLAEATTRCGELYEEAQRFRDSPTRYSSVAVLAEQNRILHKLLLNPTVAAELTSYMHGEGARLHHKGDKIRIIKNVRDNFRSVGLELKEAKDFVESYNFPPAPTASETKVENLSEPICHDASCLNPKPHAAYPDQR